MRALPLLFLLACKPPPTGEGPLVPTGEPEPEVREWVQILARPCALDSEGRYTCWLSEEWEAERWNDQFQASDGVTLDTTISGEQNDWLLSHSPGGVVQVHNCQIPTAPLCNPPNIPMRESWGYTGISVEDELYYWREGEAIVGVGMGGGRGWHALTRSGGFLGAVDADNILAVTMQSSGFHELPLPHHREVTHVVVSLRGGGPEGEWVPGACALDVSGEITCVGEGELLEYVFDSGPYRYLDGAYGYICAIREEGDVVECNDGQLYDLGPIRHLAVFPYLHRASDGDYAVREQTSFCAITTDNAIRCVGPHYPPDLLETLEALPR